MLDRIKKVIENEIKLIQNEAFTAGVEKGRLTAVEEIVSLLIFRSRVGYTQDGVPIRTAWVGYLVYQIAELAQAEVPLFYEDRVGKQLETMHQIITPFTSASTAATISNSIKTPTLP